MQGSLPSIQFPAQLFLYAIPCAIYALVRRLRGATWSQIASGLGLQKSRPVYYVWALVFFVVLGVLSLVTIYVFFPGYYDRPGGAASQYAGVELGILTLSYAFIRESIYVALGSAPNPSGWHHGCCRPLGEERGLVRRRNLLCRRQKRTWHWLGVSWRQESRGMWMRWTR